MNDIRQQIKRIGKNRKVQGILGVCCLLCAVILFSITIAIGGRASEPISIPNTEIKIEVDSEDSKYIIDSWEKLQYLGNMTKEETINKSFKLVKDITSSTITKMAKGTFAGNFDGQELSVIINQETIAESIDDNSQTANRGILFGAITEIRREHV